MTKPADPRKLNITQNLVKFRNEAGLTQAQAAQAADVPIDTIRRLEQGTSLPDPLTMDSLARIYGHAAGDLMLSDPPPARLEERPMFLLRTMPGMTIDHEAEQELEALIEEVNRKQREIRERKAKKR